MELSCDYPAQLNHTIKKRDKMKNADRMKAYLQANGSAHYAAMTKAELAEKFNLPASLTKDKMLVTAGVFTPAQTRRLRVKRG